LDSRVPPKLAASSPRNGTIVIDKTNPASPGWLVLSSSLHPESRSRRLAQAAHQHLQRLVADRSDSAAADSSEPRMATVQEVGWIDLAQVQLPLCDGESAYQHPEVLRISQQIAAARGVMLASPIYNYDVNAALKNLLELTGRAWQDKVVAMMCAAGGAGSYMSLMPLANSLMLDFRCLVLPRFVYATGEAFSAEGIQDPEIQQRVEELVERFYQVASAVPLPSVNW